MIMVALANRNRILVYIFGGHTKNFACLIGEQASISKCSMEIRDIFICIGECGSTLYVGLSGIVRNLIQ